jgi:hypothetical protein
VSALELPIPLVTAPSGLDRLRIVDRRRPNTRRARRGVAHPFRTALIYTGLPAFILVLYVAIWAAAVHAGYQEQHLNRDIQRVRIENQSLEAELLHFRSPARIFDRAMKLGMQEPQHFEPVYVPAGIR